MWFSCGVTRLHSLSCVISLYLGCVNGVQQALFLSLLRYLSGDYLVLGIDKSEYRVSLKLSSLLDINYFMPEEPHIEGVRYDPELPVLDREQLEVLVFADDDEDGMDLIRNIYEIFVVEAQEKISALGVACRDNDIIALRKTMHFIAGSAGTLGLMRMSGFFRAVEFAIDAGNLTEISHCLGPIRDEFVYGCEVFQREFEI